MNVKPLLGDWEIPRIATIRAHERRCFVELAIPGRVGSLFQDLNTQPTNILIAGSLYGDEPRDKFLNDLRGKFRDGKPVTFTADIVTATEVKYVIIDTLEMAESGTNPDQTDYRIVLRESPPPPPPPDPLGGLDAGLLDQAGGFLDSVAGALDAVDKLGSIPALHDPTPPIKGALGGVKSAVDGVGGVTKGLKDLFGGP